MQDQGSAQALISQNRRYFPDAELASLKGIFCRHLNPYYQSAHPHHVCGASDTFRLVHGDLEQIESASFTDDAVILTGTEPTTSIRSPVLTFLGVSLQDVRAIAFERERCRKVIKEIRKGHPW